MPHSLPDSPQLFGIAVTQSPQTSPPCCAPRGRFALAGHALMCIGSAAAAFAFPAPYRPVFEFFVIFSALLLTQSIIATSFALLSWRAFRRQCIVFDPKISSNALVLGAGATLSAAVRNPLPWTIAIDFITIEHTEHIAVGDRNEYPVRIPPKSDATLRFSIKTKALGPAAVVGFGFVFGDGSGRFRAEAHIETPIDIDVLPSPVLPDGRNTAAFLTDSAIGSRRPARSPDAEDFERKPFVPGDPVKYIDWRAFARRRELCVLRPCGMPQSRALLILDAQPLIAKMTAPPENIFAAAAAFIAQTQNEYAQFSIFAVQSDGEPFRIAADVSPAAAQNALAAALIGVLSYRLPANCPHTPQALNFTPFAQTVARDFKLYRQVDFSIPGGADLGRFCLWRRLGHMRRAPGKNADISDISDARILQETAQTRRNWIPGPAPAPEPADVEKTFAPAADFIKRNAPKIFWFSDFKTELKLPLGCPKSLSATLRAVADASPAAVVCRSAKTTDILRINIEKLRQIGFQIINASFPPKTP